MKRFLFFILLAALPIEAWAIDYELGKAVATVQALSLLSVKAGDTVTCKNAVVWDNLTTKDADGKDIKTSVLKGTIQHHRVVGASYWRTVMDIEGKRYEGKSVPANGGFSFAVEKAPVVEVVK